MALRLIIEDEEGATTIVPLGDEEITIGREPGNTIQLTEQNVSRQHARLTPGPDGWVIEDLDSYNGVRVNGVLIQGSVTLNEGDVVQIGDYHLAITNNAEQTTLNIERPGAAIAGVEPLRVAPSVDLPRIPAAEAAMLASVPPAQTATVTADADHRDEGSSEGKSRGLLVALLLLLLVGGGLVAYQFVGRDGGASGTGKQEPVTKAETPKTSEPKPEPKVEPDTKTPETPPDTPPATTAGEEPPPETTTGEEPVKKTTPKVDKGEKKTVTPKGEKTEKPAVPKGDPVQLLEDARKANIAGNATQAYDLAKKSYDIDKNTNALAMMGASACKMGDQAKAKAVFKKLTDPTRQKQMLSVCAERGIMLE
jgi:pSer/pThr/pTyr-binding forkhead associated (FHA) protein